MMDPGFGCKNISKSECIPVGCVPTASWPYIGGGGRGLSPPWGPTSRDLLWLIQTELEWDRDWNQDRDCTMLKYRSPHKLQCECQTSNSATHFFPGPIPGPLQALSEWTIRWSWDYRKKSSVGGMGEGWGNWGAGGGGIPNLDPSPLGSITTWTADTHMKLYKLICGKCENFV